VEVALRWQSLGASRLHIVDLDGAAAGEPQNLEVIRQIADASLVPTQLGGGIRTLETIKKVLQLGIDRVILGTAAVEDPDLLREACKKYGEYLIVSLDAREGRVATWGWRQDTEWGTVELARLMVRSGVKHLIYTDIVQDGTLTEPNFTAISELVDSVRLPVIAAGGISSLLHLKTLKRLGVKGAIIGKALYTKDIDLKDALDAVG